MSKVTIVLVGVSVALLILTPYDELKSRITGQNVGLVLGSLFFGETLFITGILVMAIAAGHDVGKNPIKWKGHLHDLASKVVSGKLFWIGFWVNATGAIVTGLVIGLAIIVYLPPQSWGLLWISLVDIFVTVALRAKILSVRERTAQYPE